MSGSRPVSRELTSCASASSQNTGIGGLIGQGAKYEGFVVNWLEYYWSAGGELFNDDQSEVMFDTDLATQTTEFMAEAQDSDCYAAGFNTATEEEARNIFQTEGFTDTYTPNKAIEAMAVAIGGDLVQLPEQKDVEGLTALRGRSVLSAPISKNVGGVTAVLAQYKSAPGSDGHYVVFDIPAAQRQAAEFLGTLARTGTATVVAP